VWLNGRKQLQYCSYSIYILCLSIQCWLALHLYSNAVILLHSHVLCITNSWIVTGCLLNYIFNISLYMFYKPKILKLMVQVHNTELQNHFVPSSQGQAVNSISHVWHWNLWKAIRLSVTSITHRFLFFLKSYLLDTCFTINFWDSPSNHLWRQDSSKINRPSSGNSNIVVVYGYLLLSVLNSTLKALV